MSGRARFQDTPLLNIGLRSAFAGDLERERMAAVRLKIQTIRQAWLSNETYRNLMIIVKRRCMHDALPTIVRDSLLRLLDGYRDYADIDLGRPDQESSEQYDALELYCSAEGYTYLYKLMYDALRSEDADDDLLLTATTIIELLTIDLYNLRLSQIGDPQYANFEGTTYRGMIVPRSMISEYEEILARPDLTKRNFAIPLGLMSSSTDESVMDSFSEPFTDPNLVHMQWTIHIHGIDTALLKKYHSVYPDSVVSSICAMPVARVSPFGEKEILLRGGFFHLIGIKKYSIGSEEIVNLEVVMMNANRDHTTETSSNEAEKKVQRSAFLAIVSASKYDACSQVARHATADSQGYRFLEHEKLEDVKRLLGEVTPGYDDLLRSSGTELAVWLGGTSPEDFPRSHARCRLAFQEAVECGKWTVVEGLINRDYDWRKGDWFNMGKLSSESSQSGQQSASTTDKAHIGTDGESLTLLHHLVLDRPTDDGTDAANFQAWTRLLGEASDPAVWKSIKGGARSLTASEFASEHGRPDLASCLAPRLSNEYIGVLMLQKLEAQLHGLMAKYIAKYVGSRPFRMPQLSVLQEIRVPKMWIPIPRMNGGFLIRLKNERLAVTVFEIVQGKGQQERTEYTLVAF